MTAPARALALIAVLGLAACGGATAGTSAGSPGAAGSGSAVSPGGSLYDRLGRRDAIAAVVKYLVEQRVAKDPRINAYFWNADTADLEAKITDRVCEITGGPCKYIGRGTKLAHAGMNIRDAEFNAVVEDLKAALDHFKVGAREQRQLLDMLGPLRDVIVTAK
jgi:hemoglobin